MDITMPETDGIEAMQAIIDEFPDAKIIMITSHGNNSKKPTNGKSNYSFVEAYKISQNKKAAVANAMAAFLMFQNVNY